MPLTCEACEEPAMRGGIRCRPCAAHEIRTLLSSPAWVAVAATRTGDFPGETMVDTMRRELAHLEVAS